METVVILGLAFLLVIAVICAVSFYQSWRGALEQKGDEVAANRVLERVVRGKDSEIDMLKASLGTVRIERDYWEGLVKSLEKDVLNIAAGKSA